MIGKMGSFEYPSAGLDEPLDCYLHGYVSSRIMNLARASEGEGLPVCIAATKVDGYVLSLTPFSHSYNYRSAVLHGYARVVTDEREKLFAMKLITNSVVPDRWDNSRVPPESSELSSTTVVRVKVVDGSGKIREGGASDGKEDCGNPELTGRVWTGVVPIWQTFGEPVPSSYNEVKEVPEYLRSYITNTNETNQTHARSTIDGTFPKETQI
jgi:nitroimidazol reductase NimA-like FMN-containing flavoprotein (pyridoxamine 5'-phosphate oxidase superfamily)